MSSLKTTASLLPVLFTFSTSILFFYKGCVYYLFISFQFFYSAFLIAAKENKHKRSHLRDVTFSVLYCPPTHPQTHALLHRAKKERNKKQTKEKSDRNRERKTITNNHKEDG